MVQVQDIFNIMSSKLVFKAAPATFLIVILCFKMVIYGEHIHMLIFFSSGDFHFYQQGKVQEKEHETSKLDETQ